MDIHSSAPTQKTNCLTKWTHVESQAIRRGLLAIQELCRIIQPIFKCKPVTFLHLQYQTITDVDKEREICFHYQVQPFLLTCHHFTV